MSLSTMVPRYLEFSTTSTDWLFMSAGHKDGEFFFPKVYYHLRYHYLKVISTVNGDAEYSRNSYCSLAGILEYHVKWFMNPWSHRLRNGKLWPVAPWVDRSVCTRYVLSFNLFFKPLF